MSLCVCVYIAVLTILYLANPVPQYTLGRDRLADHGLEDYRVGNHRLGYHRWSNHSPATDYGCVANMRVL